MCTRASGWTPLPQPETQANVHLSLASKGLAERVGYDVAIAQSSLQQCAATTIDCTFFWSRWTRWLCCQNTLVPPDTESSRLYGVPPLSSMPRTGERQPLVSSTPNGHHSTPNLAPTPQRMPSNAST